MGAAASLLAAGILLAPLSEGVPKASDLRYHLGATAQVLTSLETGDLYPRWLSGFNDGWGEPTLVFYPPGLYFVSAPLAALLRGDVLAGLYAAVGLFSVAGGLGAFAFVRRRFGPAAGALAAIAFGLMPFRVFEVYASGLYSSFAAWSLLPWAFLALESCADDGPASGSRPQAAAWPVIFAAMAFLNLPAAVLLAYLTAAWLAVRVIATRRVRGALRVALGGLWGSAIAGVHLIPAIAEMPTAQILGADLYLGNFLFQPGSSGMSAGLQSVFDRMGLFSALVLAASLCSLEAARQRGAFPAGDPRRGWALLLAVTGGTSLFFATPAARWAWEELPFLQKVNLPWRLLEPLGCAAACAAAAAVAWIARGGVLPRTVRLAVVVFFLGLGAWGLVFDAALSAANGKFSAADCRAAIPQFARMEAYFVPKGARRPAELKGVPPLACDQPCRVAVLEESPARRRFRVTAQAPLHLAVRTYFFPGWTAQRVIGSSAQPLAVGQEPGTGRIVVDLPAGESLVVLRFGTTPARRIGGAVSLAALLAWVAWLIKRNVHRRRVATRAAATASRPAPCSAAPR
ncbi:MAG: 6-pyruvoyl-tetrahydropterin synthase-related protein [Thermoanaerobaculia bacterium]